MSQKSKPVTIRGVEYPSFKAAAKTFGVTEATVSMAVARGKQDSIGTRNICPVTIRGVEYPSMSAAARDLGRSVEAIFVAQRRGTLDRVGLREMGVKVPVIVNGVHYPSMRAASKANGLNPYVLVRAQGFDISWPKP